MALSRNKRRSGPAWWCSLAAVSATLLVSACGGSSADWHQAGSSPESTDNSSHITITSPQNNATNVPASSEIVFTTTGATDPTVEVFKDPAGSEASGGTGASAAASASASGAQGASIAGAMRADGTSWVPAKPLAYSTRYTVKISATVNNKTQSKTVSFTTMAAPSSVVNFTSVIGDDQVLGVGMPLIITTTSDIPKDQRAAVEKRLFVTSEPAQEGSWNWFSAREIHFRPKDYWQTGTKISLRVATGGLPLGSRYGANDLTVQATVGDQIIMTIDNNTKQMTVTKNGQALKTIPVSLGKPSTPSSSGNMIIMVKNKEEWFDSSTYGVPATSPDGYRTLVKFTQRLSWDGQYIHAASWSVSQQGNTNTSHGCTNISDANAEWLFGVTHVGDPVIVKNTEQHIAWGNGYTDWDISFDEYAKGSALAQAGQSASAAPSPSQS